MGVRLIQEGLRDLGQGARDFGSGMEAFGNEQERQRLQKAKEDAERIKQERLQSALDQADDLASQASENENFTRQDLIDKSRGIAQISAELGQPQLFDTLTGGIDKLLTERNRARESKLDRESRERTAGATLGFKQQQVEEKKKPKTFEERLQGLSAESRKRFESATLALDSIGAAEKAIEAGASLVSPIGSNEFTIARDRFVEGFGRLQTGAAISQSEEERFASMFPKITDSKPIREKKLKDLKREIGARVRGMGFDLKEIEDFRKESESATPSGTKQETGAVLGKEPIVQFVSQNKDAIFQAANRINEQRAARGEPPLNADERLKIVDRILQKGGFTRDPSVTLEDLGLHGGL